MVIAIVCTEWLLTCIIATIWAWLRHGRYPMNYAGSGSRARRSSRLASFDVMGSKASVMRFLMIPGGIVFGFATVFSWGRMLSGVPQASAQSDDIGFLVVSSIVLVGYLAMAGIEVYLITSELRVKRPTADRGSARPPVPPRRVPRRLHLNSARLARPAYRRRPLASAKGARRRG